MILDQRPSSHASIRYTYSYPAAAAFRIRRFRQRAHFYAIP